MTPYNVIDAQRLRRLLDLVDEHPDHTQLKIYISASGSSRAYLSLEVCAHELPMEEVKAIMALPIEALTS